MAPLSALTSGIIIDEPDSDADLPSHTYGEAVAAPIVMLVISTVAILCRCWVKKRILRQFHLDDGLLILSFLLYVTLCGLAVSSAGHGFGIHSDSLADVDLLEIYRLWYFEEAVYVAATVVLKISISILLLRLITGRAYSIIIWSTAVFHSIMGVLFFFGLIFQCWPVWHFWTDNDDTTGSCVNEDTFAILAYLNATISLVTDFVFAIVPTTVVWRLSLPRRTKLSISIVLCLGFLATSVNVVRYEYIENLASPGDNSYDYFAIGVVSILEVGCGITATSLASCRPLLQLMYTSMPYLFPAWLSRERSETPRALNTINESHAENYNLTSEVHTPTDKVEQLHMHQEDSPDTI